MNSFSTSLRIVLIFIETSSDAHNSQPSFRDLLECHGLLGTHRSLPSHHNIAILEHDPSNWLDTIAVHGQPSIVGNLASPANFARFQMHKLLPILDSVAVYVDCDMIFHSSIKPLLREASMFVTGSNATHTKFEDPENTGGLGRGDFRPSEAQKFLLSAVPRSKPVYGDFFSERVQNMFLARYGKILDVASPTFNAGLYIVNLDLWRMKHIQVDVAHWMGANKQEELWSFGSQPILLLLAAAHGWTTLDRRWNVDGLGYKAAEDIPLLDSAWGLHWSGVGKPWQTDGPHRQLWLAFFREACSGRGVCKSGGGCKCTELEFQGPLCGSGS